MKITIRNHTFSEQGNDLIIKKLENNSTNFFSKKINTQCCNHLVAEYVERCQSKINQYKDFNPSFSNIEVQNQFETWKTHQIHQIQIKLSKPLLTLQEKVAKRAEDLFIKYDRRHIILGCMHVKDSLAETTTPAISLLPKTTHSNECHSHQTSLAIDWRMKPKEIAPFLILNTEIYPENSLSDMDPEGPDFAHRLFSDPAQFSDFKKIKNVQHIYAERVPIFEKGILHGNQNNLVMLKQIFEMLAPGGEFSFDFDVCPGLIKPNGECLMTRLIEESHTKYYTEHDRGKQIADLSIQLQSVLKDENYRQVVNDLVSTRQLFCKNCENSSTPCTHIKEFLHKNHAEHLHVEAINKKYFDIQCEESKEFIKNHPDKVLLSPNELYIDYYLEVPHIRFNLKEIRENRIKQSVLENCQRNLNPVLVDRILIQSDESRTEDEMKAILYQLHCYRALPVNPDLEQYLLKDNRDMLDEITTFFVDKIVFPQFERVGFERDVFELNSPNPENHRKCSRIIKLKKPLDSTKVFNSKI